MKVFRRKVLENVFPRILVKRFAFDIELLANAHHLGYKIESAPVTLEFQRTAGRINWGDVSCILIDTAAIFYRMHILRYYDRTAENSHSITQVFSHAREVHNDVAF